MGAGGGEGGFAESAASAFRTLAPGATDDIAAWRYGVRLTCERRTPQHEAPHQIQELIRSSAT